MNVKGLAIKSSQPIWEHSFLTLVMNPAEIAKNWNRMGLWVLANQADSLRTVHLRHHEVHQDEVGVEGIGYFHRLFAIFCQNEVILFEAPAARNQAGPNCRPLLWRFSFSFGDLLKGFCGKRSALPKESRVSRVLGSAFRKASYFRQL